MHRLLVTAFLAILILAPMAQTGRAEVTVGATIGDDGLKEFHLAIGRQYNYSEKEIVAIEKRKIPQEELPVLFCIARRAQVSPMTIAKLRLGGQSWWEITIHYGLSPDLFFIPVDGVPGPPYGRAYGYYKDKDKHHWKTVRLEDVEIINLVNLRFICERYKKAPSEVIRMRARGDNFVRIHGEVKRGKEAKKESAPNAVVVDEKREAKNHGQGKGHKK